MTSGTIHGVDRADRNELRVGSSPDVDLIAQAGNPKPSNPVTRGGQPAVMANSDLYATALVSILEGSAKPLLTPEGKPNPANFATNTQVSVALINRINSDNFQQAFSSSNSQNPLLDQVFARDRNGPQFSVITDYGLKKDDFSSLDKAASALSRAKGITQPQAKELLLAQLSQYSDPAAMQAASNHVGSKTEFPETINGVNIFQSNPYDSSNLKDYHPSVLIPSVPIPGIKSSSASVDQLTSSQSTNSDNELTSNNVNFTKPT